MNHFILTRFNLRLWWKEDKNGGEIQTDGWLEERFRLFETYCMPSVMRQTCQDFKWICLFDEKTPEKYKERVEGYKKRYDRFCPFYLNERETKEFREFFQQKVYELADKDDEELLTTYLDNDDCLRRDYVAKVQRYTTKVEYGTVFTFNYGIQYYTEHNIAVRVPYVNNHFLTYYEALKPKVRTVWGFWHFSIFKYKGIGIITINNPKNPAWVEVVHNGNIDNDVKMTLSQKLMTEREYMRNFGVDVALLSHCRSWLLFCTVFQIRFLKQIIRRGLGKLKRGVMFKV